MATAKKVQPLINKVDPIKPEFCKLLEHARQTHVAVIPHAMSQDDLESPDLWSMMSHKFRMFDRLQIEAADGSQFVTALITNVIGGSIRIKVLDVYDLEKIDQQEIEIEGYIIKNAGFDKQWVIVEKSTGNTLKEEISSQRAAVTALQNHFKSLK